LALVGRRSSVRLRVFLLTLVIVDDVAAVSVIAIFYSSQVQPIALAASLVLLGLIALLRYRGVESTLSYIVLGFGCWLAAYEGGVHPTVAGVAMGLVTGARLPQRRTLQEAIGVTRAFRRQPSPALATEAARRITATLSPNDRLQHAIHPWSSYVAVPLFALANAGIDITGDVFGRITGSSLTIAIIVGLVVGKTLGIPIGAWIATRPRLGGLQLAVGWPQLIAASAVAGIGFTVSLLIAQLAYSSELLEQAKLGILVASILAAVLSIVMFYALSLVPAQRLKLAEARAAPPLRDLVVHVDPARDHVRGPAEAAVTIVEYGDFEDPRSGAVAPAVRELLGRHPTEIQFVFRHLPLADIHRNAPIAADAAEAAARQGKFWEMHDLLFAQQGAWLPPDLPRLAQQIGLDVAQFERDLRDGNVRKRVAKDIESADAAGVVGTPTFFINDVLYRGARTVEGFDREVDAALELTRAVAAAEDSGGDPTTDR
jgi:Na+/H+ antiporter NhaA